MFCTSCGTKNLEQANFCKQCGHKMERSGPIKISEEAFNGTFGDEARLQDLLLIAFGQYKTGKMAEAIKSCSEALKIAPNSTDAHSLLSTLYEKEGNVELAIAERERVLELNPGSIADRDKLDELREGPHHRVPRSTATHRSDTVLMDGDRTPAIAAACVLILVLAVGSWMVYSNRDRNRPHPQNSRTTEAANPQVGSPPVVTPQNRLVTPTVTDRSQPQNPGWSTFPNPFNAQNDVNGSGNPRLDRRVARQDREPLNVRELEPAPVNTSNVGTNRNDGGAPANGSGTVHLPETDQNDGGNGATVPRNDNVTKPPSRIEIVVAPGTPGSKNNTASPRDDAPAFDSEGYRRIAQDLQSKGQYKRAAAEYSKALTGAGDSAGSVHQQIAICYRNLNDPEKAVNHYTAAIAAFRSQIAAGKNVASAQAAIRTCEAGIKSCQ